MKSRRIDRITQRGNIREHRTLDGERTMCGIAIEISQEPAGNAVCKRCQTLADERDDMCRRMGLIDRETDG